MDQVEEDLKRMKITGWRVKIEDRQVWNRIVEQTKTPTQGCRVNRRRRYNILQHCTSHKYSYINNYNT